MSKKPVQRYNPRKSRENVDSHGTEEQRRAYWIRLVGGDAAKLGYANGIKGKDPDGLCLNTNEGRAVALPDEIIVTAYLLAWEEGRKAAANHPVAQ